MQAFSDWTTKKKYVMSSKEDKDKFKEMKEFHKNKTEFTSLA
jgi:hypothetical protein